MRQFRFVTKATAITLLITAALCAAQNQERPDLIITDLWFNANTVYYQVMNAGDGVCPAGHSTQLRVDDEPVALDEIDKTLDPGDRLNRSLDTYNFNCNKFERQVTVIANYDGKIDEHDNDNNKLAETWKCDRTAPLITEGPTVSSVDLDTASVTWTTNEDADSVALYSSKAQAFDLQKTDAAMVLDHSLILKELMSGTTYQYKVQSSDAAGNTVVSKAGFFTTQSSPDSTDPNVSSIMRFTKMLPLEFHTEVSDDKGVDRVEFRFDGLHVVTDYDAPFECFLSPAFMGINADMYFDAGHTMIAEAFDEGGNNALEGYFWTETPRCREMELTVGVGESTYLYTPEESLDDYVLTVDIMAKERREGMDEAGRARLPGRDGGVFESRWGAVQEIEVYFDDVYKDTLYPATDDQTEYTLTFNTGPISTSHDYEVRAEATGNDSCVMIRHGLMRVVQLIPEVEVTRTVTRNGSLFDVTLRIENTGTSSAYLDYLRENIAGLLPIFEESTHYEASSEYRRSTRSCRLRFDFDTLVGPGMSMYIHYEAVPILYEGFDEYAIGSYNDLHFHDSEDRNYVIQLLDPYDRSDRFDEAFGSSDYLLVTNTDLLYGIHDDDEVNGLLHKMAELASIREGVLGFFGGSGTLHTSFDRNDRIVCGNVMDDWRDEIIIAEDEDDRIRVYSPAQELTVGELPIVVEGLHTADALIAGDLVPDTDPFHPRDEIAIIDGHSSGPALGAVTIYQYDSATETFSTSSNDIAYDPGSGDQVLCGDMIVTSAHNDDEIVLFKGDGMIYGYYDSGSTVQRSFSSVYEPGDPVAIGNLLDRGCDEIIIGDADEDRVYIYSGHGDVLLTFDVDISSAEHLAVCYDGLMIADASGDQLTIWRIESDSARAVAGFHQTLHTDDVVLSARILGFGPGQQFLFARGHRNDHYTTGNIDVFTYSVYDGSEVPGDRYDLDRLFNPGGEWADKMTASWTHSGYLLLVGELEIIPSYSCSFDLAGSGRDYIEFTDNYYGNTADNMKKPEITVGRIIGNSIENMLIPMQTSIDVANGDKDLDFSHGYAVSGEERRHARYRRHVADILDDDGWSVTQNDEPSDDIFFANCSDRDAIYMTAHGNHGECWNISASDVDSRFDPGDAAPVVIVNSCRTGRYPAGGVNNLGERFLQKGASVYVGATENSFSPYGGYLAEGFFGGLDLGTPVGLALRNAKRNRMGDRSYGRYQSAIYHYFGDPKLEAVASASSSAAMMKAVSAGNKSLTVQGPVSSVSVKIPDYLVEHDDGVDTVRIPGGTVLAEVGKPELPAYPVEIHFPAGYCIGDVQLTEKSGLQSGTGLNLPTVESQIDAGGVAGESSAGADEWPDRDFDWSVEPAPDGTSTLTIYVYPMRYYRQTTNFEYFGGCEFDITYNYSDVFINRLCTDSKVYPLNSPVTVDMYVFNAAQQPVDVIAQARIVAWDESGEEGLEIKRLMNLGGLGSCSWQWESTGFVPGSYEVQVQLTSPDGTLLDSETHPFRLGISTGRMQDVSVVPGCFAEQDNVLISTSFNNTGQADLSGRIIVEVRDADGKSLTRFEDAFAGLAPNAAHTYQTAWTALRARGGCRFIAYALFDGKSTPIVMFPHVSPVADGDVTEDGMIGLADFSAMAGYWLTSEPAFDIAPLGGDCSVNMGDLKVLIDNWMEIIE